LTTPDVDLGRRPPLARDEDRRRVEFAGRQLTQCLGAFFEWDRLGLGADRDRGRDAEELLRI
jgi:hypothetical protein